MKRLALLVSLVLLSVVGTTTTTQAYYLDTPHNESNGIYCYTCHYTAPFTALWSSFVNPDPINDPDNTMRNAICLVCHGQGATHINRGPVKAVHANSTANPEPPNYGNWTTECTQCHDVHSQGQQDYAGTDDAAKLFLVTGTYATGATPQFLDTDDAGGLCNTVLAPTVNIKCGTTTIEIEPTVIGEAPWTDKTKWGNKGGLATASTATDGSRGLVLVANAALPDHNFEIISVDVTGTILKVKGKMLLSQIGAGFGIIYGQSIRSFMMPTDGTTLEDMRVVKFFKPGLYLGEDGGYVDQTPGVPEPTGLCQVCHMATKKWTADTVGFDAVPDENHNNTIPCSNCHNVIAGGAPEVIQVHTTYIVSDDPLYGCACHGELIANPDKHTTASCATCHVTASPNSTNKMINSNLMTDLWLTGDPPNTTVLGALLDSGYTMDYRLLDASGDTIISPTFDKIDCGDCHEIKRHQIMDQTHGGHAATDFGWDAGGVCIVCHAKGANEVVADIHGNGVDGTCTICHDGSYNRIGGEDGTAVGGVKATSTCTSCHSYNGDPTPLAITSGKIHHSSSPINTYAQNGNCAFCHATVGHKGDHLTGGTGVATYVNCNGCHSGNAATTTDGTPVDVAIDDPKVHDNCLVCHILVGDVVSVRTLGEIQFPRGIVTAMPATGGTCFSCHGEYFNSHTINHSVFVQTTTNCSDCHDGAQGTTENIVVDLQSPDNPKVHDFCSSCHATNGLLKLSGDVSPGGVAQVMQGVTATCENCHTLGFNGFHQTVVHTNMVRNVTGNCDNCHTQAGAALNSNDGTRAGRLVHDTCATCHQNNGRLVAVPGPTGWVWAMPINATFGGTDGGGTCTDCHGPFEGHITVSHVGFVAPSTSCDTAGCHPATAGDATGVPRNVATPDRLHDTCFDCHNANGTYKTSGYGSRAQAMPVGGGACTLCHTTFTLASHNHTHLVSYNATNDKTTASGVATSCASCHNDAGTSLASWAAIYQEHLSDCGTCHSYTNSDGKASPPLATNNSIIQNSTPGTCVTCHTEKGTGQPDHSVHPIDFGKTFDCTTTCHTGASVLVNIHGNGTAATCTMCHSAIPATRNNEMAGASLDGIDGDNRMADGAAAAGSWATKDCLTCHTPGTNLPAAHGGGVNAINAISTGGMHHLNKGGITNCATSTCHSSGKLLHTTSVDTVADCNTCHDSTAGGSFARLASAKPYTIAGQVHDQFACLACHALGASPGLGGILKTGTIATLNNNGTQAWVTNGGTDGGGTCTTCHGAYFASHTNVDHTDWVGVTSACTTTCHTATMGNTIVNGTWISAADNKKHDSCATCHQANGVLRVAPIGTTVDAMPTLTAATNDGGGVCTACHRSSVFTFDSHIHHTSYNETVYSSTIDRSQQFNDATTACAVCHKDKTNTVASLDTFDGIRWEHDIWDGTKDATGGCTTCHDYKNPNVELTGTLDTPVPGDVTTAISTTGTKYCTTCHVKKLWSNALSTHGGHAATEFAWQTASQTSCGGSGGNLTCHNSVTNTDVVNTIHNGPTYASGYTSLCKNCHSSDGGGDATYLNIAPHSRAGGLVSQNTTAPPHNPVECNACHTGGTFFDEHVSGAGAYSHATEVLTPTNVSTYTKNCLTTGCHNSGTSPYIGGANDHTGCDSCHNTATNGSLLSAANGNATVATDGIAADGGRECEECHASWFNGHKTHTNTTHAVSQQAGDLCVTALCNTCHRRGGTGSGNPLFTNTWGGTDGIYALHQSSCTLCHDINTSGKVVMSGYANLQAAYQSDTGTLACLNCHNDRSAAHGGHGAGDFAWTTASQTSCGTWDCHNYADNPNVVEDVHGISNNDSKIDNGTANSQFTNPLYGVRGKACLNCHTVESGGDGFTLGAVPVVGTYKGYVGSSKVNQLGGGHDASHDETCVTCHGTNIPIIHHYRNPAWSSGAGTPAVDRTVAVTWSSRITTGNCYKCHNDSNYVTAGLKASYEQMGPTRAELLHGSTNVTEKRPGVTPCAFCHMQNTTGATGVFRVKKYLLSNILVARASNVDSPDPFTSTYTHLIPNYGSTIAIQNSGNCLHCHGSLTNRPANYPNPTNTKALGRAIVPRHAWVVAMISGNEKDAAEQPRIRMGLHPGHQKYRLMSTQPSPAANNVANPGRPMNDRLADGKGNEKLYNVAGFDKTSSGAIANSYAQAPKDIGKTSTLNFLKFKAVWGTGGTLGLTADSLRSYLGNNFTPVATQSVPYTINGGVYPAGPYTVPMNP